MLPFIVPPDNIVAPAARSSKIRADERARLSRVERPLRARGDQTPLLPDLQYSEDMERQRQPPGPAWFSSALDGLRQILRGLNMPSHST